MWESYVQLWSLTNWLYYCAMESDFCKNILLKFFGKALCWSFLVKHIAAPCFNSPSLFKCSPFHSLLMMDESDKCSFAHLNFFNDLFSPVSSFNVAREKISIVGRKSFWMWRGISPAVAETTDRCRWGLVKIWQKQDWDKKIVGLAQAQPIACDNW